MTSLKRFGPTYLICFLVFLAIDAVWLGLIAPKFYYAEIGHLLAPQPNLGVAALFYLMYIAGIVYFAVLPGTTVKTALIKGAALGFFAYATYDLTNWATLRDWPVLVVVVDLAWGTVLTGSVAAVTRYISNRLGWAG